MFYCFSLLQWQLQWQSPYGITSTKWDTFQKCIQICWKCLEILSNKVFMGAPNKRLLKLSHFCWLSHPFDFHCTTLIYTTLIANISKFLAVRVKWPKTHSSEFSWQNHQFWMYSLKESIILLKSTLQSPTESYQLFTLAICCRTGGGWKQLSLTPLHELDTLLTSKLSQPFHLICNYATLLKN